MGLPDLQDVDDLDLGAGGFGGGGKADLTPKTVRALAIGVRRH